MSIQENYLSAIASALRGRGHSGQIKASDFSSKINQLPRMIPYTGNDLPWCGSAANQAVAVARSYWDAKNSMKRQFTYSNGRTFFDTEKDPSTNQSYQVPINDENGNGLIDCSTFIRLVLSGVDYCHSPYATGNPADSTARKDLYRWADEAIASNNIRYAADLAEYFFLTGRVLNGFDDLRPGDIIFHANGSINNRFMCISHISIVAEDDGSGEIRYYNATNYNGVIIRTKMSARNDYIFAARPNYEPTRNYPTFDENINLLTPPWYSVPGTINGCTMSVGADGESMAAVGTPTSNTSFSLFSKNYPLYLLPGHYKLSGAPKRPDVDSGYTWGLVVAPFDSNEALGWDLGNGAEFTLEKITPVKVYIYISSSKTPDGYTWVPKLIGINT